MTYRNYHTLSVGASNLGDFDRGVFLCESERDKSLYIGPWNQRKVFEDFDYAKTVQAYWNSTFDIDVAFMGHDINPARLRIDVVNNHPDHIIYDMEAGDEGPEIVGYIRKKEKPASEGLRGSFLMLRPETAPGTQTTQAR